jgi:hypothetical protein
MRTSWTSTYYYKTFIYVGALVLPVVLCAVHSSHLVSGTRRTSFG